MEPAEQSVEQEDSQAGLGMEVRKPQEIELRSRKEFGWSAQKSNVGGNRIARLE